jgi:transposase
MLGFSAQRPAWQALERDPERRRQWTEEDFPALRERAVREGAVREGATICFADEAYCRTGHHAGTTWAPAGRTPVAEHAGKREGAGMLSAVSPQGEFHWMVYSEPVNSELFTDYLRYLTEDVEGKIFLVADRARYHTSRETARWIMDHKDRIELFFLPPYSPDLNPDEQVWKNVKHDSIYRIVPQRPGHLSEIASQALKALSKAPEKIRGFFADPNLAYILRCYP